MDATTPPSNIHIALSVGEPVKKREMSEVNDVDAITPNTISTIAPARRASETALLMFFPLKLLTTPAMTGLMGWLVIGIFADLVLGAHNLAEAVVILGFKAFLGPRHPLVAGRRQLPRIFVPGVQRLRLFVVGKFLICHDVVRLIVCGCGTYHLL